MSDRSFIKILIAEDNDVSRQMMTNALEIQGYKVFGARDGGEAIDIIMNNSMDLALVDINMAPEGGFEFMRYLLLEDIKLPVIVITGDDASDMLVEARSLGAVQVLTKPIKPHRLTEAIERFLKKRGYNLEAQDINEEKRPVTPDEIMQYVIHLAIDNAHCGKGAPFAAVVVDDKGAIIGQGTNGLSSRINPMAHAEVMAIHKAAEKLQRTELFGCTLYSSCAPTAIGKALIASVAIEHVYYALSHEDLLLRRPAHEPFEPTYHQMQHDEAYEDLKNLF